MEKIKDGIIIVSLIIVVLSVPVLFFIISVVYLHLTEEWQVVSIILGLIFGGFLGEFIMCQLSY